jgi:hypothetical protein
MQDQDRIGRRAHEIWEREGRPEGRSAEHWTQACREIEAEGTAVSGNSPTPTAPDHGGSTQGQDMRLEGIEVLVVECLGGRILDGVVHALSLAVGPRMVPLGQAVFDAVLVADNVEDAATDDCLHAAPACLARWSFGPPATGEATHRPRP